MLLARDPLRILGPPRSARMAMGLPVTSDASRVHSTICACSSCVPCAKLMRTTSTPSSASAWILSRDRVAGPTVATILVRTGGSCSSLGMVDELAADEGRADGERQQIAPACLERIPVPDHEIGDRAGREHTLPSGRSSRMGRADCVTGQHRVEVEPLIGEPAGLRSAVQVLALGGGKEPEPRVARLDWRIGAAGKGGSMREERAERIRAARTVRAPMAIGTLPVIDQMTGL